LRTSHFILASHTDPRVEMQMLMEHQIVDLGVPRSSRGGGTNEIKDLDEYWLSIVSE
jgi:hypothetical protein